MSTKNYYLILGISRSESAAGIRSAFRDLARQHHPDRAGPAGAPRFREIVEAYRVLSDPESRREHDADLRERDVPVRHVRAGSRRFGAVDLFARPDAIRPSAEALLDHLLRNLMSGTTPKAERPEPLLCDVLLTPAEARSGGLLPIRVPIAAPCVTCHGTGHIAGFPCRACGAAGRVSSQLVVPLEVPPGVRPGSILEMPLDSWGIRNLWLHARIGVGR